MRVLTLNAHTGCDEMLATLGYDFEALTGMGWDHGGRKVPANWKIVSEPSSASYDLLIYQRPHDHDIFGKKVEGPAVLNQINDGSEGVMRADVEERIGAVTFLSQDIADRWEMADDSKKRVIRLAAHPDFFAAERTEDGDEILTVGRHIPKRWDKGYSCLKVLSEVFRRVTVVGPGNELFAGDIGERNLAECVELYAGAKVYFNPGLIIGASVAEAMAAGCPIVSMRPINLTREIKHKQNAIICDTLDAAMTWLKKLLTDKELRRDFSDAARETARKLFTLERFQTEWKTMVAGITAPSGIER